MEFRPKSELLHWQSVNKGFPDNWLPPEKRQLFQCAFGSADVVALPDCVAVIGNTLVFSNEDAPRLYETGLAMSDMDMFKDTKPPYSYPILSVYGSMLMDTPIYPGFAEQFTGFTVAVCAVFNTHTALYALSNKRYFIVGAGGDHAEF